MSHKLKLDADEFETEFSSSSSLSVDGSQSAHSSVRTVGPINHSAPSPNCNFLSTHSRSETASRGARAVAGYTQHHTALISAAESVAG